MRLLFVIATIILTAGAAAGQQSPAEASPQPIKTFASSADVSALIAKAKADRRDGQPTVSERILHVEPYNISLEYRTSVGPASVHEHEAELFYVIEGKGTLVTGGKLVNEKRSNPTNLSGTAVEGGTPQEVAKGDFILVPENTPHWFSRIDGELILMSFHVPHPEGPAR